MAESNTFVATSKNTKGAMFKARVDVTDAMQDFSNGVANSRVLKGAAVAAVKRKMLPQIIANYGGANGGPGKVTGAMSNRTASKVKGIWFKDTKVALAIGGLRTNNRTPHILTGKNGKNPHRMEKWHANLVAQGHVNSYRVDPGVTVRDHGGRGTILNKKAWKINDGVQYDMAKVGRKVKRVVRVFRNPANYSHLIEKGHRFATGTTAKAYEPIQKAQRSQGRATQAAMMHEVKQRAQKEAARAAAKAGKTIADTHNMVG